MCNSGHWGSSRRVFASKNMAVWPAIYIARYIDDKSVQNSILDIFFREITTFIIVRMVFFWGFRPFNQ